MLELVKITALYSNAVLTAILPHVSDFAQRAELRTEPITANEVQAFYCDPRKGEVGGRVVLTNGWQFWFLHGHVDGFETPKSYFSLQDPTRIPEFIGPVKMDSDEALALGRRIISKLNGVEIKKILARNPRVTGPIQTKSGIVPRYRIEWPKADVGTNWKGGLGTEIDLEINASDKTIEMLALVSSTNFFQSLPKVDVVPEVLPQKKPLQQSGGVHMTSVSQEYSNAFILSILPAINEYATKLDLPIPRPITTNMIRQGPYTGVYDNGDSPEAQIELTNHYMFKFQHGYVEKFVILSDCFHSIANTKKYEDFVGPIKMTKEEVIQLGYDTIRKLGYSEKDIPALSKKPIVGEWQTAPANTNGFSRIFLQWDHTDGPDIPPVIGMEIDTTSKTVKGLSIKEPNLYRAPPKIEVPMQP